jgi:predicted GNAT family acetyltransferase
MARTSQKKTATEQAVTKVRELNKTDWPHITALFGSNGACGGCWCMSWRITPHGKKWSEAQGETNRKAFKKLVESGKALGILAFDGNQPVGWCAYGRRTEFPHLESAKAYHRDDIEQVWSINCYFILAKYRNQGVATALTEAAIAAIKKRKGKIIETYPTPLTKGGNKLPAAFVWTGPEAMFKQLGFKEVQRLSYSRPLYRLEVKS